METINRYAFDEIDWPDVPFDLREHLVLAMRRGSESHGTYIPSTDPNSVDDRDVMGVCIPPISYFIGLDHWEHAEDIKGPWDVVLYEFRKFINLLIKQNPNVITMLWLRPEDYIFIHPVGKLLIDNRNLFRCRKAAFDSFMGYADSQLKRMTHMAYKGYMGDKRKKLVDKYGYDCKNGAHLIRLLHMGEEFMRTGEMQPFRTTDRDMIVDIKTGGWSLSKVQDYANKCFVKCRESYEKSCLPEAIDINTVNNLVVHCVQEFIRI